MGYLVLGPGKAKCEGEMEKQRSGAAVHSGKTPNDTGPDSHHSSERVRVSGLTEDPPRARIKFPRGIESLAVEMMACALANDVKREWAFSAIYAAGERYFQW